MSGADSAAATQHRHSDRRPGNCGFTLLELLVVLGAITLLMALLIPAVQQVRAAARLATCRSHLRQIGIATHSYLDVYGIFPGAHLVTEGPLYNLLPYIDQPAVYIKAEETGDRGTKGGVIPRIPLYICPEDPTTKTTNVASYLMNKGVLPAVGQMRGFVFEPVRVRDVTDGLSQTGYFSEIITRRDVLQYVLSDPPRVLHLSADELDALADLCAVGNFVPQRVGSTSGSVISHAGGYNHLLPPGSNLCTFSQLAADVKPPQSGHPQGANVLFADGSVRFVSETVARRPWWASGTIDGGEAGFDHAF